jgi:TolB-like protein
MASVFVSYAREDASKARAIALALDQAGFDTWIDERIHSGAEFSREIEQALAGAGAVVVLWSTSSIDSAWVRDEAAEGRDSGRLVAVLLDTCRPPIGFRQFQATDLSRWSGRGRPKQLDAIIAAVRSKAGESPKPRVTPATEGSRLWLGRRIWLGIAPVLAAVAVGMFFFIDRSDKQAAAAPSIAILPFTADSSDPDGRRLASEARNSIAHTLSHGAFAVTTIDSAPNADRPPADFLLTGQVSTNSGNYSATVRMDETAHHYVVFSRQFEASRDKVGDFAELIGVQVAALVSWTAPILAVERRHPSDPAITAALLQSTAENFDSSSILHDYETSRRLAAKAPDSPMAQNGLAFNTAFALPTLPRDDRAAAVAAARRAVDRTIELAPEFGGGYIPWCMLRSELWLVECEDHLRTGMRVDPDAPFNDWFLAVFLNNVGRNREATELATVSLAHDQYMPYKIALMLRMLEIAGRTDEEASLYRQAQLWWPGSQPIAWYRRSGTTQGGDFEAVERLRRESDPNRAPDPLAPLFAVVKAKSASAGKAACSKVAPTGFDGTICMLALARLGDMDGAYRFADALYPSRLGRTPAEEEQIWLDKPDPNLTAFLVGPSAAPLRRDLRYIPLATRVGLVRDWRSGRPPDFCRERPEPICPRLLGRAVVVKI